MNEEQGAEERFYRAVAEALNCDHDYKKFPYSKRTRWNNRLPGNGRYPEHGFVRRYSANKIHVQLRNPQLNGVFDSEDAVIRAIKKLIR